MTQYLPDHDFFRMRILNQDARSATRPLETARFLGMTLSFQQLRTICERNRLQPPNQTRLDRLMLLAAPDLLLMDESEFEKVVYIQLILTRLRARGPHRPITLHYVFEILVMSISKHLCMTHYLVADARRELDQDTPGIMDIEICRRHHGHRDSWTIRHLQKAWRRSLHDRVCLESIMVTLGGPYMDLVRAWRRHIMLLSQQP